MALIKNIALPSGHECEYWRIIEISTRHLSKDGYVTIIGYKDAAAREAGMQPLADSAKTFYGYSGHGGTPEAYAWLIGLTEPVPEQMVPNPDYDPEQTHMIIVEGPDGQPVGQPNPDFKPQFLVTPAGTKPGLFADALSDED